STSLPARRTTELLVTGYLLFLLVLALTPDPAISTRSGAIAALGIGWAFFGLSIAAAIAILRRKGRQERPIGGTVVVLALLAAVPLRFLAAYITGPGVRSAGGSAGYFPFLILMTGIVGSWLIAPFAEEWVFRGYLLPAVPTWRDVSLNALVFAAFHPWNFAHVGPSLRAHAAVLVLGLALAATKKLTRSTWACVALHFFINVSGLLMVRWVTEVVG